MICQIDALMNDPDTSGFIYNKLDDAYCPRSFPTDSCVQKNDDDRSDIYTFLSSKISILPTPGRIKFLAA